MQCQAEADLGLAIPGWCGGANGPAIVILMREDLGNHWVPAFRMGAGLVLPALLIRPLFGQVLQSALTHAAEFG